MTPQELSLKADRYLQRLSRDIPSRCVGSPGNRDATTFFAEATRSLGFQVECPAFDCIDWITEGAQLTGGGHEWHVLASPFTLGCQESGPLVVATSLVELERAAVTDSILLLRGDLTREPLTPKRFPFYTVAEHQHILQVLETKRPRAILAATGRSPAIAGGVYPFPYIEDGDVDLPSAYLADVDGDQLVQFAGRPFSLTIQATRLPAKGCNVIARKRAEAERRVVLFAHIDSKAGTPGALDNAAGVVVLLLLAEAFRDGLGSLGLEIVALNGEDYYNNPGEVDYLARNRATLAEILVGVNIDSVGYRQGRTAYSLYECPDPLAQTIRETLSAHPGLMEGEAWYQGDHMLLVQNQKPAVAFTSEHIMELLTDTIHTTQDTPALVDSVRLAEVALALHHLLIELDRSPGKQEAPHTPGS